MKKLIESSFKKIVVSQLKFSSNTTTSGFLYQKKAPKALEKYSRVK